MAAQAVLIVKPVPGWVWYCPANVQPYFGDRKWGKIPDFWLLAVFLGFLLFLKLLFFNFFTFLKKLKTPYITTFWLFNFIGYLRDNHGLRDFD